MIKLFNYFLLICLSMFAACGGGGGNGTATETTAEVTVDEMLEAEAVVVENEVVERQFFGQNGNLWKPSGDDHGAGAGNLVVLLSSQFKEQFDSCEVVDRDGVTNQLYCLNNVPWTHTPFSCFSNGNRQTWRANFKCSDARKVKVSCFLSGDEYVFTVPEAQQNSVCSRFG